jgi:hypothetical protein
MDLLQKLLTLKRLVDSTHAPSPPYRDPFDAYLTHMASGGRSDLRLDRGVWPFLLPSFEKSALPAVSRRPRSSPNALVARIEPTHVHRAQCSPVSGPIMCRARHKTRFTPNKSLDPAYLHLVQARSVRPYSFYVPPLYAPP